MLQTEQHRARVAAKLAAARRTPVLCHTALVSTECPTSRGSAQAAPLRCHQPDHTACIRRLGSARDQARSHDHVRLRRPGSPSCVDPKHWCGRWRRPDLRLEHAQEGVVRDRLWQSRAPGRCGWPRQAGAPGAPPMMLARDESRPGSRRRPPMSEGRLSGAMTRVVMT
jgi:hypothetical protein